MAQAQEAQRPRHPPPASASVFLLACRRGRDSPTVDRDGPVLAELLLGFMHLTDEVDEALP